MKVTDYIVEFLAKKGSERAFGYIGGSNALIFDSLDRNSAIGLVNSVHEQGAGFAAEGYARVTGETGIATATSGPGATNLLTPMASCYLDSVPVLFITGQCNTTEYKYDLPIRQGGFQEVDIVGMATPISKYAVLIDDLDNVRYELEKAYFLTQDGRKGPVLIDLPLNMQYPDIDVEAQRSFYDSEQYKASLKEEKIDDESMAKVFGLIDASTRPVILLGGGARIAGMEATLNAFLAKTEIPVVYSLMGKDIIKDTYRYNLGLIGSHANRYGNLTLANADLMIVIGSRLDPRQTGWVPKLFAREAKVIHVNIDEYEFNRRIEVDLALHHDAKVFVDALGEGDVTIDIETWQKKVLSYKTKYPSTYHIDGREKIENKIIEQISEHLKDDDIVSVDVGSHQMWAAQSLEMKGQQRVLLNSGLGAMGCALPTAIGSSSGTGRRSIVIVGDGGFQMNIQELEVLKRRGLPIKIFILNNASLGMVMDMQDKYLENNYIGTKDDYSVPDFSTIAKAYGIRSRAVSTVGEIYAAIENSLMDDTCEVIDIHIDDSIVHPDPSFATGKPIEDLYPLLDRDEFKAQMIIKPVL